MSDLASFSPPFGLRNPHIQSALRSLGITRARARRCAQPMLQQQEEWLLDGGDGVRLQGFINRTPGERRGLVVLLHGWEGSVESTYMLTTGERLLEEGFDVFRLNFRDHGDTHHLNQGIFHSCRLGEVQHALADMQARSGVDQWKLAGFSLGGNFALRVALNSAGHDLGVRRCIAVCPVINPDHVLKSMETGPTFYERYYNRKWADSLRRKQALFPDRYEYEAFYRTSSMRERTRLLATRYYGFDSLNAYLDGYCIGGDVLAPLKVHSTILTAADDPVVPVTDIDLLPDNPDLDVVVTPHGGHCGYLKNWKLESWAEDFIVHHFSHKHGETEHR